MRILVSFLGSGFTEHLETVIERGIHGRDGLSWKMLLGSRFYDVGDVGTLMLDVTGFWALHYHFAKPSSFELLQEWNPFSSINLQCA
jgi:hypothetical protein